MTAADLLYVRGDATSPIGRGPRAILHIVNSVGAWGSGFVVSLSNKWDSPELSYREWFSNGANFNLGEIQPVLVETSPSPIWVINMLAQEGIGFKNGPPIRYSALRKCLAKAAKFAADNSLSIHAPRIGSGLAGGDWPSIERIIKDTLCASGLTVTIYDL